MGTSEDMTSDEMAALLQILDKVEQAIDRGPIAGLRQLAELHGEAKSKLENPATPDRSHNPFVDRIATAMTKLRAQGEQN